MAIAPVRLKINTPGEYERETTGERVVEMREEGESDKARESDSKTALKEKQGERLGARGGIETRGPDVYLGMFWFSRQTSFVTQIVDH